MKNYAVFIDDDELMLKAIRRTTKRLIPNWKISLISDSVNWSTGLIEGLYPNIIFCDFRMPALDGAELLQHIARQFPLSIRVLMTGDTRGDILIGSSGHAHSLLNKPFSDQQLVDLLDHVEKLKALPFTPQQQLCLGQLSQLPVLPAVVESLRNALNTDATDAKTLAGIIVNEPLIAARILQIANSAYLGFQRATVSLDEAISRLGTQLLYALTISFAIETATEHMMSTARHQQICRDTQNLALLAKNLCRELNKPKSFQEQVFTCAILSGTGRLVMAMLAGTSPALYQQLTLHARFPDILITLFLLTLWCYPSHFTAALMDIENAPLDAPDSWINMVYYATEYRRVKDNDHSLADFMTTLPMEVKSAIQSVIA